MVSLKDCGLVSVLDNFDNTIIKQAVSMGKLFLIIFEIVAFV